MPREKERLKRSYNGLEIGFANSFYMLLFILSGPEDFPSLSVCNTDLTSSFVIVIVSFTLMKFRGTAPMAAGRPCGDPSTMFLPYVRNRVHTYFEFFSRI